MRAYMKSALPFWGVKKKARQAALTPVFAAHPVAGRAALEREVRALWFGATHREERYAALDLMRRREHRGLWTPAALPLLEELVVTGAWWDLVDELATKLVRATLGNAPESAETLRRWSRGDDLWLRRAAILAQIGLEDTTDRALGSSDDAQSPALAMRCGSSTWQAVAKTTTDYRAKPPLRRGPTFARLFAPACRRGRRW